MKVPIVLLLALGVFAGAAGAAPVAPLRLSMTEAVRTALQTHPSAVAAARRAEAAARRYRSEAAFPSTEFTWLPFWGSADVGGSDEELTIHQPLDVLGQRRAQARVSGARWFASQAEAEQTRADLALAVRTAYIDLLLSRDLQALNQSLVDTATRYRDAAQKRFAAGDIPRIEVDRAALELARTRQALTRARTQAQLALADLNVLMGRPLAAPLELKDALEYHPVAVEEKALEALALRRRPALRAAQQVLASDQAAARLARMNRYPTIAVEGKRNEFGSQGRNAVLLVISAPLFDFGEARNEARAAEAEAAAQKAVCDALRRRVCLQVQTALKRLREAETLVKEYQSSLLPQTAEVTQTIRKGFAAGASTMLDVLDAQRTLRSVQTEYRQAVADYLKAKARLDWATGAPPVAP